jgi:hypothetical protein
VSGGKTGELRHPFYVVPLKNENSLGSRKSDGEEVFEYMLRVARDEGEATKGESTPTRGWPIEGSGSRRRRTFASRLKAGL